MTFKAKCIDASGNYGRRFGLVMGDIYEFSDVIEGLFIMKETPTGFKSITFDEARFEKLAEPLLNKTAMIFDELDGPINASKQTANTKTDLEEDKCWQLMRPRLSSPGNCACDCPKEKCPFHKS